MVAHVFFWLAFTLKLLSFYCWIVVVVQTFTKARNFRGLKGLGLEGLLIQARSLQQNRLAQRGALVGFLGTNLRHQFWVFFFRCYLYFEDLSELEMRFFWG